MKKKQTKKKKSNIDYKLIKGIAQAIMWLGVLFCLANGNLVCTVFLMFIILCFSVYARW